MAFDFDRHWRLLVGGSAVAGLATVLALHLASSRNGEPVLAAAPSVAAEPSAAAPIPLPPILAQAELCLSRCAGGNLTWPNYNGDKLPEALADALKMPALRKAFETLVAAWPQEYAGIAHMQQGDREDLPLEGSTATFMTTQSGRTIQIFYNAGYPEKQWVNSDGLRRPVGLLTIAVDIESGEMAGVFNGPETLSDYRFSGSDDLVGALMAYLVATEFHSQKLQEMHYPENEPRLTFPLGGEDLANASARLRYLGESYKDGLITGTKTVDQFKEEEAEAKGLYWYTVNSAFSQCNRNDGPASFIESYGGIDQVTTEDFRDANGSLIKVDVIVPQGGGVDGVTSFYKSKEQCMTEQVNRNRDLADRYRSR